MKLTDNFSLEEMLDSDTAERYDIEEQFNPPRSVIENLKLLCTKILQPLSDLVDNKPIMVSSGYRSPPLNKKIGGAHKIVDGKYVATSEHCYGMAADLKYFENGVMENRKIFDYILQLNVPFGQLIYEFGDDRSPRWVHISYNENRNRKQILKAYKLNGKTKYDDITDTYEIKHFLPKKEEKLKKDNQFDKVLDIIKSFKNLNTNSIKEEDFKELTYKLIKFW